MTEDELLQARATSILQQTLLGDAAEHAEVGVMVWNEERHYVAINDHACRMLGRPRAALLGAAMGDTNPANAPAVIDAVLAGQGRGRVRLQDETEVEWICVPTEVAGMPHLFGLMWRV
ncbi:MAG TPA: PAS domain-containing protein [Gaiellaceae bacterium]|nr:PAS domain-containing protein [Gaiellaceae bacterium]